MSKQEILLQIEKTLKSKEKSIRDKNAIEQLISIIGLEGLYNIFFGVKERIEFERQKLTLDEVIELIIALDQRLGGVENEKYSRKISILLENITAKGDVIGFEGSTSSAKTKEVFKDNPMAISMHNIISQGKVIGMKLNIDEKAELKQPLSVKSDLGIVEFNPGDGRRIIFGGRDEDSHGGAV